MADHTNSVVVPWINSSEFQEVYKGLFYGNTKAQKYAIERINVWKSRSILPVAIDSTCALIRVVIGHVEGEDDKTDGVRNAYSLAIIRFVNHITERAQVKQYMQPVHRLAGELGVPEWIVNLRHDATHGNLPSMDLLKTAADWCIKWLKEEYWDKQMDGISCQNSSEDQDNKLVDEVEDLLIRFKELKKSASPKKGRNKKLSQLLKKLELAIVCNRDVAVTLLAELIQENVTEKINSESEFSCWEPVLHIYHNVGLSLPLLKCLTVTENNHVLISSLLYQFANSGFQEKVVNYIDFLLSCHDDYSVISLLERFDLLCLLPENKAEQLTRIMNFQYTDEVLTADRIFHLQDLKIGEEKLKKSSDSPWKICRDCVNWSQLPIGSLPGSLITYTNLTFGDTMTEEDVAMDTCSNCSDEETEFVEDSIPSE